MSDLTRALLDASTALVAEEGVRAVSIREVARRAGVSHQAPYHLFQNERGLLRAIAAEGFAGLAGAMDDAGRLESDAGQALIAAGCAYVAFARAHVGHFRVMFQHTLVDIHDADEPVGEAGGAHATLRRLVGAAHTAGYGAGLSTDSMTTLCWATVHGIAALLVEGVVARKRALTPVQEAAIGADVVSSLGALLGIHTPTSRRLSSDLRKRAPKRRRTSPSAGSSDPR